MDDSRAFKYCQNIASLFQNVTGMVVLNMILSSSTNMKLYDCFKEQLKENG